ncbi:MAG: hypothetical protein ACFFCY_03215 [Promethearchaeota archaeon]
MKLTIYEYTIPWRIPTLKEKIIDLESTGVGTESDPFIIENVRNLLNFFEIHDFKQFIIFRNCKFQSIIFRKCQNIHFDSCSMDSITLEDCTQFLFTNIIVNEFLTFLHTTNVKIEESTIKKLKNYKSNEIKVRDCDIKRIKEKM